MWDQSQQLYPNLSRKINHYPFNPNLCKDQINHNNSTSGRIKPHFINYPGSNIVFNLT